MRELALIDRCFRARTPRRDDVALGIGDDAAVLRPPPGAEVVSAACTWPRHHAVMAETDAAGLAHTLFRSTAAALAERGVRAAWATLALTLPEPDLRWLDEFSSALCAAATQAGVELVGGDTTRGTLRATFTLMGPRR